MKKLFVLILLLSILAIHSLQSKNEFSFSKYFNFGELTTYTKGGRNQILPNIQINGNGKIIGESIKFENCEPIALLTKLNAKICFFEYIEERDLTIIYAYTNLIEKKISVKKHKINIQLAHTSNYTVIGWPLILGSF